jgi:phosphoglucosamine mutase
MAGSAMSSGSRSPSRGPALDGLKVVVDCANGAAYRAAPEVLWELGAEVIPLGRQPLTAQHQRRLRLDRAARPPPKRCASGADLGICLDGDADRVILIDETGPIADGDQIMALIARAGPRRAGWRGRHAGGHGDVESRARALPRGRGGSRLERTGVGDRYVVERMRAGGFNLGGEQSGHIVMTDYATTGDGLMAGCNSGRNGAHGASRQALARQFEPVPQLLRNVRFAAGQRAARDAAVKAIAAIAEAEAGTRWTGGAAVG